MSALPFLAGTLTDRGAATDTLQGWFSPYRASLLTTGRAASFAPLTKGQHTPGPMVLLVMDLLTIFQIQLFGLCFFRKGISFVSRGHQTGITGGKVPPSWFLLVVLPPLDPAVPVASQHPAPEAPGGQQLPLAPSSPQKLRRRHSTSTEAPLWE